MYVACIIMIPDSRFQIPATVGNEVGLEGVMADFSDAWIGRT